LSRWPRAAAAWGCALLAACSAASPTSSSPAPGFSAGPGAAARTDWPAYHRTPDRAGALKGGPFHGAAVAWQSDELDGDVYGSPLVVGGRALVATENNTVYAFDAASGGLLSSRHLGAPVDAGSLPCGNIAPVSGITSTPVADPSARVVYAAAFLAPGHHQLFTIALTDGTVRGQVGVDPPGEDPLTHQQRAALALGSGRVYVAYGGLFGDCGRYHGWVVGAPASGSGANVSYRVPSGNAAGLWAPSGPAIDAAGNVYIAAGNSFSGDRFDYGNAVIKLSPALSQLDWFAPAEWQQLNGIDGDLGSMGPLLLGEGLLFQSGKPGVGHLLRTGRLGGIGGQAFAADLCTGGGGVRGGAAAVLPLVYVPCSSGLLALRVDQAAPAFKVAWRASGFAPGPPIVAGGAVWSADAGSGALYALDPETGRQLFQTSVGELAHFATPAASDGLVLVAAGRRLVVLRLS